MILCLLQTSIPGIRLLSLILLHQWMIMLWRSIQIPWEMTGSVSPLAVITGIWISQFSTCLVCFNIRKASKSLIMFNYPSMFQAMTRVSISWKQSPAILIRINIKKLLLPDKNISNSFISPMNFFFIILTHLALGPFSPSLEGSFESTLEYYSLGESFSGMKLFDILL